MVVGHALALVAVPPQRNQVGSPIHIVRPFGCHGIAFFATPDSHALRRILDASEGGRFIPVGQELEGDRKSTRLNSSHLVISYAVFCLKKKKTTTTVPASAFFPPSSQCGSTHAR